jgi:hypothetical protein
MADVNGATEAVENVWIGSKPEPPLALLVDGELAGHSVEGGPQCG